jgi:hypothetical protein
MKDPASPSSTTRYAGAYDGAIIAGADEAALHAPPGCCESGHAAVPASRRSGALTGT